MAPKNKKNAYNMQYAQEHFRQIKFNLSDIYDKDIISHLDSVQNKQGYIKSLIRADIARANSGKKEEEQKMKYQVNYTDPTTGANSPIDTITARAGYTAEDYIRDCDENADSDWCEMLHRGEVSLELIED